MDEHLITTGGRTFRVPAGDEDLDAYLAWLVSDRGEPVSTVVPTPVAALSRQQVFARIRRAAIPSGFPEPDVVIGDTDRDSGGFVRGWLPATVQAWQDEHDQHDELASSTASEPAGQVDSAGEDDPTGTDNDDGAWRIGARRWTGVGDRADRFVRILTSRGAVTPSGVVSAHKPLDARWLGGYVWKHWPHKPALTPQLWITAPALAAAGMSPPKRPPVTSADLSDAVAKAFGCEVTSATAGWFTATFRDPAGGGEARRVSLVLLPFRWLDPASQRPNDEGMAGTRGAASELPDDEDAAVAVLGARIAWLAGMPVEADAHKSEPPLLPAARPASIGAELLDVARRRKRSSQRIEACPIPATVTAETPRLDPDLENWKNKPHTAKGTDVDVEVDQRAAFLASTGHVHLGYGVPRELKPDPETFAQKTPPFGLWRVTTPPGGSLDGLSRRLPLPHEHMAWESAATFWATTRAVQHLLAPVDDGGAGLSIAELAIDGAWVWPQQDTMLRGWTELLRKALAAAQAVDDQFQTDLLKNVYKSFLGRMAGSQHPPGQRHYQQPAWVATIHADTRWRAMRYAATIAATHGLHPIAARDIDTFVYRVPADMDPYVVLNEPPNPKTGLYKNGSYRVKKVRTGEN
ncbi:hypothetical protein [Mycobacterium syngnathidarum]|uniref:hypothetical protein n=1 Tax=Mycobacterium syngnathidarum TaxID=1908205 RepID=UPI00096474DA|nr:hypothetical protein [Mycobacterium syngnathidarum]OLT97890.1 hypothetical protein BKG60_03895 [Mycobacterium syngnathidarum]